MKPIDAVILSAGLGTRMKSKRIKVLHPIGGRPMILHLLDRIKPVSIERIILVLGRQNEKVKEVVMKDFPEAQFVYQEKQLGTGHALAQAEKLFVNQDKTILVLNGDTPFISHETLLSLIRNHQEKSATLSLLTAGLEHPEGYGRIIRDRRGKIQKIVEERDATPLQRKIAEVNTGIYLMNSRFAFKALKEFSSKNVQDEIYLTDIVASAVKNKKAVETVHVGQPEEVMGINNRVDLSSAEALLRKRAAEKWMKAGVTLIDPHHTYIEEGVIIGKDTVIYPGVYIKKGSRIGEECTLHSNVIISNSRIQNSVLIKEFCVITDSILEEAVVIGPFAHLRPGSIIRKKAHIGNFVEIKKTEIGEESKANHLSYLGDSVIGKRVNIGAGTITCNYDGVGKHQTVIGDDVFVGSDTQFIAPVTVESGSVIGAGSTIVENIPKESLSLSRAPQIIKKGWVSRKKIKIKKER
ncbi:MAG: bifunctional UDP-N-acetylglucosamine diphosphorylase/glucosamine-1-phosphate N-acetyltransferase GlmU [Nitrospirae bacterium]|nr:bifunctional UDP-N-acetylglucosamine diphosphorylase/glucosamine-1-phosphate N-acetyltransferase GlmU [Nitrospirota bacterium]